MTRHGCLHCLSLPDNRDVPVDHKKIRAIRRQKDITQEKAAKLAGLPSRQAWHQIESGRSDDMKVSTLERIAKALGVQPSDLLK
jgi:transcriptional regulator with XRE-family HTH domain